MDGQGSKIMSQSTCDNINSGRQHHWTMRGSLQSTLEPKKKKKKTAKDEWKKV